MNKKYIELKKDIYSFYKKYKNLDIDNIQDINDKIVDNDLGRNYLEDFIIEFYVIVSMCVFMIENNLFDEYFFNSYKEMLEEFNNSINMFNLENEKLLRKDIDIIEEYLKKDQMKINYYDKLSEIYENKTKKEKEN